MGKTATGRRRYCKEWEKQDGLKEWITSVPGEDAKAACRFCRTVLRAHLSDLKDHCSTKKHKKNALPFSATRTLLDTGIKKVTVDNTTNICELKLSAHIACHSSMKTTIDHLGELVKTISNKECQHNNNSSMSTTEPGSEGVKRGKMQATSVSKLAGKIAIITGASSGIGAATAKLFSRLGATLTITGRNLENLNAVAADCTTHSDVKPLIIQADVTNEADTKKIMDETIKKYGKLDILVNNAGILEMGTIENTSLEQYDRLMNTNVRAIYHLTMLATPHLLNSQGNIVNVSSVNGIRSFPGVLAYNISKAAVDQMTRCVALELAEKKVRVNCVNPGVTVTELQKRGGLGPEAYANFLERSKTTHALGRPGEPEEVAATIAFLASDDASFITGVSLPVDGGRHAMCPR